MAGRVRIGLVAGAAVTFVAAPVLAGPPLPVQPHATAGVVRVGDVTPRTHPLRSVTAPTLAAPPATLADAAARLAADSAQAQGVDEGPTGGATGAPGGRANVVGRVENGVAVPLSATAFAERAEAGPVASLFSAAEAASTPGAAPGGAPGADAARQAIRAEASRGGPADAAGASAIRTAPDVASRAAAPSASAGGAAALRADPSARMIGGAAALRADPSARVAGGAAALRGDPSARVVGAAAALRADPSARVVGSVAGLRADPAPGGDAAASGPSAAGPLLATHGSQASSAPEAYERYGATASSLRDALDALKADRFEEALSRRNGLSDPLDRKIVDYFLIRSAAPQVNSAMVADFAARAPGWPSSSAMRARAEEALSRERPDADTVLRAMGGAAQSPAGTRILAKALLETGDRDRALRMVRAEWSTRALGPAQQEGYLNDFGQYLTVDDHLTRIDRLVGLERFEEAKALRSRLGTGARAYLDARVAIASGNASRALLDAVPAEYRKRVGYRLTEIELLRRQDDTEGAAKLIESTPQSAVADGDPWWVEARIVARDLGEKGDGRRAYALVAKGFAQSTDHKADEAFHAGWFALIYLKDGRTAEKHFADLERIATTPISLARAGYWRGRAADARGDRGGARAHYNDAAKFGFTYYGQLSRAALRLGGTGVPRAPQPTAADRAAFANNEVAEAVRRLIAVGAASRIVPLIDHLGDTVPTAGQVTLTAELAQNAGMPNIALMAAKDGQKRGLPVGGLAYPTAAIPTNFPIPVGLDRAVVYSIARQESEFNPGAVSPVGARGLMQVMPQTAAAMAKELGIRHSVDMLTSDPRHNATLGAAYLAKRLGDFDGSYILTFAAYNAGATKVREWIGRFGDPRDPRVDPVTWVEQIPYPETRNYVMRVMENVQVYREELGTGRLAIDSDLARGRAS